MNEIKGDILSVKHGIIVQQVNCQGVMGGGVALAIRKRYPQVWDEYNQFVAEHKAWQSRSPLLGKLLPIKVTPDLIIANIFGQEFFGNDGKRYTSYDALDNGFAKVWALANESGQDVHYPLIGAGLGGGQWPIISSIINCQLTGINHTLWVLE